MKRLLLLFCSLCASIYVSQAQITEITNSVVGQGVEFNFVNEFHEKWMNVINNIYLYNNRVEYSKEDAPYPYKNGRILSGKYKSSNAAFNEYVNQLKSYKDKKYKFVKAVKINPVPEGIDREDKGLLFVSEENDTILYWYSVLCSSFVEEGVEFTPLNVASEIDNKIEAIKNTYLGKQFVYINPRPNNQEEIELSSSSNKMSRMANQLFFTNKSNNMSRRALPMNINSKYPYSIWTLDDILRKHTEIVVELHNETLGNYYGYFMLVYEIGDNNHENLNLTEGELPVFFEKNNLCDYLSKYKKGQVKWIFDGISEEFADDFLNHLEK